MLLSKRAEHCFDCKVENLASSRRGALWGSGYVYGLQRLALLKGDLVPHGLPTDQDAGLLTGLLLTCRGQITHYLVPGRAVLLLSWLELESRHDYACSIQSVYLHFR